MRKDFSGGASNSNSASTSYSGELCQYKVGSILRIVMKDFLIYEHCEIRPGPYMNMIIGPNGTGKSTVVCAIALGLGGQPALLGRSKEVNQFVRYGTEKAEIDIWLKGEESNQHHIKRVISIVDGTKVSNSWYLNNRASNLKDVLKIVSSLEIQLDNLCQFMPQDRVIEFSQSDSVKRLSETELAAGDKEMYTQHVTLKELCAEERTLKSEFDLSTVDMERLTKLKANLEKDVDAFRQQEGRLQKIKWLEYRLPWLSYETDRSNFEVLKGDKEKKAEKLKAIKSEFSPLEEKYLAIKDLVDESLNNVQDKKLSVTKITQSIEDDKTNAYKLESEADDIRREILTIKERQNALKAKVNTTEQQISDLDAEHKEKANLVDKQNSNEIHSQLKQLKLKKNEILAEKGSFDREIKAISQEGARLTNLIEDRRRQISKYSDKKNERIRRLRDFDRPSADAYDWLERNRDRFEKPVFGPIVVELDVKDPRYINYVATTLGKSQARTKNDYDLFSREVIDRMKLTVNVNRISGAPLTSFRSPFSSSEMEKFGFEGFLIDMIDGPEPVLALLCEAYKFHMVPFSLKRVNNELVEQDTRITRYCAEMTSFEVKRYHGDNSQRVTSSLPCRDTETGRILFESQSKEDVDTLEKEIEDYRSLIQVNEKKIHEIYASQNELGKKIAVIDKELEVVEEEKNKYFKVLTEVNTLSKRLDRARADLKKLKMEQKNSPTTNVLQKKLWKVVETRKKMIFKMVKTMSDSLQNIFEVTRLELRLHESSKEKLELEAEYRSKKDEFKELEAEYEELEGTYKKMKIEMRRNLNDLTQRYPLTDEAKEAFATFPDDLEELRDMLTKEKSISEMRDSLDGSVVDRLEDTLEKIRSCEKTLLSAKTAYEEIAQKIDVIRDDWYPRVKAMTNEISERFKTLFDGLGFKGQVKLEEHGRDFEKWGIDISVSFRAKEDLAVLSGQRQSGGEKSVTTITYLMALQGIARSPFRVVDEINQGMDPNNERNVHGMIVDMATTAGTSQYFIITPKLLQDLKYNENVTVLCVYNGSQLPDSNLKLESFV